MGQSIAYVVGAGGAGGINDGNGSTGGTSTASGGTYSAGGGIGGLGGEDDNTVATLGGTASGGDTNTTGGSSTAVPSGNNGGAGGTGAGGGGAGGAGGTAGGTGPGSAGTAPGGGGGGGAKTEETGGAGAAGRVSFSYTLPAGDTYDETGSGGCILNGLSPVKKLSFLLCTGGAVCNGESTVSTPGNTYDIGSGGAVCGGVSPVNGHTFNNVGSGGVVCGGRGFDPIRTEVIVASANHVYGSPTYFDGVYGEHDYGVTRDNLDDSWVSVTGSYASVTFPLTDMPDNFWHAIKIRVLIRCHRGSFGDLSSLHSVQCFLADGTTALSDELIPDTIYGTIYTYALETDALTSVYKSDWDAATFRITSDEGEAPFYIVDFSIYMTYERTEPTTYDESGSGGVVCNGVSKVSSPSYFTASGGAVCNGAAIAGLSAFTSITGGLTIGGAFTIEGGGVVCGGTAFVTGNLYDEYPTGGVVCGGTNKAGFILIEATTTGAYLWGGSPVAEGPIGYVNWCATTSCGCRVMDFEPTGNLIYSGSSTVVQEKIGTGGLILRGKTKISWNGAGSLDWLIPLGDLRKHPYEIIQGIRTAGTNLYRRNGVFCLPSSQFVSEDESNCLMEADTIAAGQDFSLSFWCRCNNRFIQRCLFVRGNYVPLTTGNWSIKISVGHYGQIVLEAQDIENNRYEMISETTMNDEWWQHVAISVENSVITLFINGEPQDTQIELENILGASNGNSIGVHNGRSFPDCYLQEFRCYNDYQTAEYWLAEYTNFCDYSNFVTVGDSEEYGVSVV